MIETLSNPFIWVLTLVIVVFIWYQQTIAKKAGFVLGAALGVTFAVRYTILLLTNKNNIKLDDGTILEINDNLISMMHTKVLQHMKNNPSKLFTGK